MVAGDPRTWRTRPGPTGALDAVARPDRELVRPAAAHLLVRIPGPRTTKWLGVDRRRVCLHQVDLGHPRRGSHRHRSSHPGRNLERWRVVGDEAICAESTVDAPRDRRHPHRTREVEGPRLSLVGRSDGLDHPRPRRTQRDSFDSGRCVDCLDLEHYRHGPCDRRVVRRNVGRFVQRRHDLDDSPIRKPAELDAVVRARDEVGLREVAGRRRQLERAGIGLDRRRPSGPRHAPGRP